MNELQYRIDSFHRFGSKWPHKNKKFHNVESFAKAGFYYITRPKLPDTVRCFMCDIELSHWKQNQSPFIRHARESPHCAWVILNFPDDTTRRLPDLTSSKVHEALVATFDSHNYWPPIKSDFAGRNNFVASTKLAGAGFYFSPTIGIRTRVQCIACRCIINEPFKNVDPLKVHLELSDECEFIDVNQLQQPQQRRNTRNSLASTDTFKTANSELNDEQPDDTKKRKTSDDDSFWDIGKALFLESTLPKQIRQPTYTFGKKQRSSYTKKRQTENQVNIFSNVSTFKKREPSPPPPSVPDKPSGPVVLPNKLEPASDKTKPIVQNKPEPIIPEPIVAISSEPPLKRRKRPTKEEVDIPTKTQEIQPPKKDKGKGRAIDPPADKTISLSKTKPKPAPSFPKQSTFNLQSNTIPFTRTSSTTADVILQSTPVQSGATPHHLVNANDIFGDAFSPITGGDDGNGILEPFVTPMQQSIGRSRRVINEEGTGLLISTHNRRPSEIAPVLSLEDNNIFDVQEKNMTVEAYLQHVIDTNILQIRQEGDRLMKSIQEKSNVIKQQLLNQKVGL
ncbi:MAG: hypothetical protein EXX96DRAFT_582749 [Benjaminiella poitrasii]|nr:MAG: hypothetical protein EXX96DRAFT_582749 [Benjaminiella poitrasii]